MQTDPIADLLTRIRNGARAKHPRVDIPASKLKVEVARILKEEGYICELQIGRGKKTRRPCASSCVIRRTSRCVITDLKRVSRPGSRRYTGKADIRQVVGGMGISHHVHAARA